MHENFHLSFHFVNAFCIEKKTKTKQTNKQSTKRVFKNMCCILYYNCALYIFILKEINVLFFDFQIFFEESNLYAKFYQNLCHSFCSKTNSQNNFYNRYLTVPGKIKSPSFVKNSLSHCEPYSVQASLGKDLMESV